jgi:hypothetical protein
MGLTYVTVKLTGLTGRKAIEEQFLVAIGAIDCLAPTSALRRIGIKPVGKDVYELELAHDGPTDDSLFDGVGWARMGMTIAEKILAQKSGLRVRISSGSWGVAV